MYHNVHCSIVYNIQDMLRPDVEFIAAHPMAGREFSGFEYSTDNLFEGASFIITPTEDTPQIAVDLLQTLAGSISFGKAVVSTPQKHDEVIAYTSQLAHVVSNAYVKSPSAKSHKGISAGSYKDLTRVAYLNENMWTELFMDNRDNLLREINGLIENLSKYSEALENEDSEKLRELLIEGKTAKEMAES